MGNHITVSPHSDSVMAEKYIIHFQTGFITKNCQIWLSRARIEIVLNTGPSNYTTCFFSCALNVIFFVTKILVYDVISFLELPSSQKTYFLLLVLLNETGQITDSDERAER